MQRSDTKHNLILLCSQPPSANQSASNLASTKLTRDLEDSSKSQIKTLSGNNLKKSPFFKNYAHIPDLDTFAETHIEKHYGTEEVARAWL